LGQKVNPVGLRVGIVKTWSSQWFDEKNFAEKMQEDILIRNYVNKRLESAAVAQIQIERNPKKVILNIHTARPGIVIGKKGSEVDKLREELKKTDR
jgi:small subunit ribosomal protein S3